MYAKGEGEVHTKGMTGPRDWVYVIDPQPQGRDLDAHNISFQIAKAVAARKADADAKINPGNDFLASLATASALSLNLDEELGDDMDDEEREVSVPGFIPSGEVRGAIPRGTNGELDYSNLVKNPHYDADKFGE
jgi:hypothetical protein